MTGKKYNVCLVGAGRMGARWAKTISDSRLAKLALVIDPDIDRAKEVADQYGCQSATRLSIGLLNQQIDAVVIATPHRFLFPYTKFCLKNDQPVLVEKPGAVKAKQMKELSQLAKKRRLSLTVGFNYRFFDAIKRAKKIVASGQIGSIQFLRLRHGQTGRPGYEKEWRMNKALAGGGVLMDHGVHNLDLVNWLLGSDWPTVTGLTNNLFWQTGVEDNAFVLLKNRQGQIASLHMSVGELKPIFSLEIFGRRGYCLINGLGRKYGGSEVLTIGRLATRGQIKEQRIVCNPEVANSFSLEFKEFINSIRDKRQPQSGAEDALAVLKIVEKIYARQF